MAKGVEAHTSVLLALMSIAHPEDDHIVIPKYLLPVRLILTAGILILIPLVTVIT